MRERGNHRGGALCDRAERTALPEGVVDPHKKVDTSGFLVQRMRRVARALEGLRTRLTRPAHSLEAFRWRLRGPVGPLALAERLAESEDRRAAKAALSGAAFLVAEVARTLKDADWTDLERTLGRTAVRKELGFVRKRLRDFAYRAPAPPSLRSYVEEALRR